MENDDYSIKINDDSDNNSDIFKPDYKDQEFTKTADFQKWKKQMFDKHGKKGKFYTCSYDNIMFYSLDLGEEDDNIEESAICPKCRSRICFFCKYNCTMENRDNCCYRQILHCMHKNGIKFLNSKKEEIEDYDNKVFYFFLIPCINFILLANFCSNIFFYKLHYSHANKDFEERYVDTLSRKGSEVLLFFHVIMAFLTFLTFHYSSG